MVFKKGSPVYATEVQREQGEDVLYINAIGAPFVPSIAESPDVMARAIDLLADNPNVSRIVFVQQRNYHYPNKQVLLLAEIARLYNFLTKQEEILSTGAVQTTLRALYLSELICSQGEAEPEDNCIDLIKAEAVQAIFQKYLSNYYFHLFGYGRLTLHEVYPQEKELVLYEKRRVENLANESTFMMVSLRDDRLSVGTEPSYAYGYLLVEVYS